MAYGNLDVVNEDLQNPLDLAHPQQDFQVGQVSVVSGKHDGWRVPTRSIDDRNEIVVAGLVLHQGGGVEGFVAVGTDLDGRRHELDAAEASRGPSRGVLAEHASPLATRARVVAVSIRRAAVQVPQPASHIRRVAAAEEG